MPKWQVDEGAVRHILSGADVMAPGLTSAGGRMEDCEADTPIALMAENKLTALAIGVTKLSAEDVRTQNKGMAVEVVHFIGDGLFKIKHLE
jgi:PUA domain protein